MADAIAAPFLPIIYVRGHAATMAEIEDTTADPYMGFNRGATLLRQDAERQPVRSIFESPLLRLIKDHGYEDAFRNGGSSCAPGEAPARGRQVAEMLAGQLGVPLQRVDLAAIASRYIGETEKNLDRVLAETEAAGALLWLDEVDALFGKRGEVKDAHDRYANIEAACLLQRLDAFNGLVVLTCMRSNLDAAFPRCLRFVAKPDRGEG
jgi:hypothetical protein